MAAILIADTGPYADFSWPDFLMARRTRYDRIEIVPASPMLMQQGPVPTVERVPVAPMHHPKDDRVEVKPLFCQPVFVA